MSIIPLRLNLTEFIKTGNFGFINSETTKLELENNFFPPEDWSNGVSQEDARIWRYGNFELHFSNRFDLDMIFNDYIPKFDGGKNIIIEDWWLFKKGKFTPNLMQTINELIILNIDFRKTTNSLGQISLKLSNDVFLNFQATSPELNQNPNQFKMFALGKTITLDN